MYIYMKLALRTGSAKPLMMEPWLNARFILCYYFIIMFE